MAASNDRPHGASWQPALVLEIIVYTLYAVIWANKDVCLLCVVVVLTVSCEMWSRPGTVRIPVILMQVDTLICRCCSSSQSI